MNAEQLADWTKWFNIVDACQHGADAWDILSTADDLESLAIADYEFWTETY